MSPPLNWKALDEAKFISTLREKILDDHIVHEQTFTPLRDLETTPLPADIDRAAIFIQDSLIAAAEAAAPQRRPSKAAKQWWTKELTELRRNIMEARRTSRDHARNHLGQCPINLIQNLKHAQAVFDRRYKAVKRAFYDERIKKATNVNYWDLVRWTRMSRQYHSPPLS
jgi:hypothetical protein